jgi:hypothetical protein
VYFVLKFCAVSSVAPYAVDSNYYVSSPFLTRDAGQIGKAAHTRRQLEFEENVRDREIAPRKGSLAVDFHKSISVEVLICFRSYGAHLEELPPLGRIEPFRVVNSTIPFRTNALCKNVSRQK